MVGHVSPEAADGGPLALVEDGDMVVVDVQVGREEGREGGREEGYGGHVSPEAADGGPLALVEDGDMVVVDVQVRGKGGREGGRRAADGGPLALVEDGDMVVVDVQVGREGGRERKGGRVLPPSRFSSDVLFFTCSLSAIGVKLMSLSRLTLPPSLPPPF